MKKLLALSMSTMMLLGMTTVAHAEETDSKNVDTSKGTTEQNGEVWGSVSETELKQLKVALPIKVEFILSPTSTGAANKMTVGDYKVIVPSDSEVGVNLTNIKITPSLNSKWKIVTDASIEAEKDNLYSVDLSIAGAKLAEGSNAITNFSLDKNTSKSLSISGGGSKKAITAAEDASRAFDIVYTIEQKK